MGDKPLPAVPDRILTLKTPPFPVKYTDPLVPNDKLDKALKKALGPARTDWRTGVCIAHLDKKGAHPMAHFKGDKEFFGASMIKVAALYGLYELRNTLREIATELGKDTSESEFLKDAARYLNPKIWAATAKIEALAGIPRNEALPQYSEAFAATKKAGGGVTVDFSPAFKPDPAKSAANHTGHIEHMIVVSDNISAGRCVHACGYGYLNSAMAAAGLLEPGRGKTAKGLYLAGDYVDTKEIPGYNYYRIASENDGAVAQAGAAIHTTRMLALLDDEALFGKSAEAKKEVLRVMEKATELPEVYINRASALDFKVLHNKLGVADLKPPDKTVKRGPDVESECAILEHTASKKRFAVTWLNYRIDLEKSWDPIGHLVRDTINEYLKP